MYVWSLYYKIPYLTNKKCTTGDKLMIYLNSGFFTPFCIFISIAFLPISSACLVLTIFDFRMEMLIVTLIFWLIYFLILWGAHKFSVSKKYFLCTDEKDFIIIHYPNVLRDLHHLKLNTSTIVKMEYYRISSFRAWCMLYNCVCPQCLYITYLYNGNEEKSFIGYPNFNEMKKICDLLNIELIVK